MGPSIIKTMKGNEKQKIPELSEQFQIRTVPKYNGNIVERDKVDTPNTQIHDQLIQAPQ